MQLKLIQRAFNCVNILTKLSSSSSSLELSWKSPLGEFSLLWRLLVRLAGLPLLPLVGVRLLFFTWTGVSRASWHWQLLQRCLVYQPLLEGVPR